MCVRTAHTSQNAVLNVVQSEYVAANPVGGRCPEVLFVNAVCFLREKTVHT